jgi:glycosyltransferase A (GT-A) superfamily protein (DUF2064 family)/SAM-dependent methyltransferase
VTSIVLLAKEPVPGRVKTRLHARFTPQEAARLATAALADTVAAIRALEVHPVIAYDGRPGPWLPRGFHPVQQVAGDLSLRIESALLGATIAQSPEQDLPVLGSQDEPVVLVGMDTPQLSGALAHAVEWCDDADAVLGLTDDGGYWAIGLRRFVAGSVQGVPMSTDHSGRDQLERLRSLGLRVRLLAQLRDVDTPTDAAAVASEHPLLRFSRVYRRLVAASKDSVAAHPNVFDAALAGRHGGVAYVDPATGAAPVALDHERWLRPADAIDRLVVSRCRGPALDIGCGPGRFVRALAEHGIPALGVDSSPAAVELTAGQGAAVLHRAVQGPLPGEGRWGTVLLMDGNIGIGGDVEALLCRCRELIRSDGMVIVEVEPDDRVNQTTTLAVFDDAGGWTGAVAWARTGSAACARWAARAGLEVAEEWSAAGRAFLSLRPAIEAVPLREAAV